MVHAVLIILHNFNILNSQYLTFRSRGPKLLELQLTNTNARVLALRIGTISEPTIFVFLYCPGRAILYAHDSRYSVVIERQWHHYSTQ